MMLANIPPPPDSAFEVGPLTIHFYGIAIALGVLAAIVLARRRYASFGGDPELTDRVALWGVLAGVVGARLAWVSTNFGRVLEEPPIVFAIWRGGLAFYGGLLLGGLVTVWVLRRARADIPAFVDAAAPAVPLAQAIGRWGNYFNEELYGTATDLPWGLVVRDEPQPVHPTFLYESLGNLVIVAVLLLLGRRGVIRRGGLIFCYGIGYGILRFLLELIRTDTEFRFLYLSRNGWVSLGVFLAATAALVWWQRRGTDDADADEARPDEPDETDEADEAAGSSARADDASSAEGRDGG